MPHPQTNRSRLHMPTFRPKASQAPTVRRLFPIPIVQPAWSQRWLSVTRSRRPLSCARKAYMCIKRYTEARPQMLVERGQRLVCTSYLHTLKTQLTIVKGYAVSREKKKDFRVGTVCRHTRVARDQQAALTLDTGYRNPLGRASQWDNWSHRHHSSSD